MEATKINIKNLKVKAEPDPYIIKSGNYYYIYATNVDGVRVFRGEDLYNFEDLGFCLADNSQKEFWAPCVIEIKNKFYMFYSSISKSEPDIQQQKIKLAVSNFPDRDFAFVKDILPPFSIDPHVVLSGQDYYIFYSVNDYSASRAGTYIVVDKLNFWGEDNFEVENTPVTVARPTIDEEIFMKDRFIQGQHWHTLEGAFYLRNDDYHFVMYSGNCYENEKYYVGYASAKSSETDLRKLDYKKYPNDDTYLPLLCKNDKIEGTGHNSCIKVDNEWYIVYHAREVTAVKDCDTRCSYISKFSINENKIKVL